MLEQVTTTWRNVLKFAAITDPLRFKRRLLYSPFGQGRLELVFRNVRVIFVKDMTKRTVL